MPRLATIALLCVLAGCAGGGMEPQECLAADWRAIGYEDGAQGRSVAYFGRHREACAKHGITADFAAYQYGHGEGIAFFCRPQNGYQLGARGYEYQGVCPIALEDAFLDAHADGYDLHTLRNNLRQISRQLNHSKKRAAEIEYILTEKTAKLIAPNLDVAQRATLAVDIKQLAQEKGEVEIAVRELEHEYAAAEHEYEAYRQHHAYRYGG